MEAKEVDREASDPNTIIVAKPPIPDHPPYAEMVRVALLGLADEEGSTEAAISAYIVSAFSGLPPRHADLLPYYLRNLVASGFLAAPSPGRFLLLLPPPQPSPPFPKNPNPNPNPDPSSKPLLTSPRRRRRSQNRNPKPSSKPPSLTSGCRRGRGRPPKNAAAGMGVEAVVAPVSRGRGRPRKRAAVAAAEGEVAVAMKEEKGSRRDERVAPPQK